MERDRFDRLCAGQHVASTLPRVLRDFFALYVAVTPEIWLLQLGANDALRDDFSDFLRKPANVTSLLVEPQRACVEKLTASARENPRWRILPFAFAEQDGTATLFQFDAPAEKGIQLDVFASFDRNMLEEKKRYFNLQASIVGETVEACTLATLLARGSAPRLDVLVCDIEGLDHAVIRQLTELRPLPVIVVFEQRWLTVTQRRGCYQLLDSLGYGILHGAEDAWCFRLRQPKEA
jgi:FkbM family methyltransferase